MTKNSRVEKGRFEGIRHKNLFSILVYSISLIMLVVLMTSLVSAATNKTGDVAYIYKAKLKVDQNIVDVFKEMNLTVDLIDERYMPKNFSAYKFIFAGDERFSKTIPINEYNSIVTNYYFGQDWGLTDFDGISNLASTFPLSVRKGDQVVQVYTDAKYPNGISIPYYYLGDDDKVPAMQKIAGTFTGNEYDFGDVISYANAGTHLINGKNAKGNICFYGIVASKYWTPEAKQMFKDCVNFVGTSCSSDLDCPGDKTGSKYCKNSSVYQDSTDYFCSMPGSVKSQCNSNVLSNLIETCTYGCMNGNCLPQCTKNTDCSLNQICSSNQCVNITCKNDSDCDDSNTHTLDMCNNPGTISSTCSHTPITCLNNGECGTDGLSGNFFCQNKDVVINFVTFTCNYPGTISSTCSNNTIIKTNKTCADACNNGACVAITCYNDSQCDDNNVKTIDTCLNPGTGQSTCTHVPVNCSLNSDCGNNGLTGNLFCQDNNIFQNFLTYTCNSPGTGNATCSSSTSALLNKTCVYGCLGGNCLPQCTKDSDCSLNQICSSNQCVNITCKTDLDCEDNNPSTTDKCNNPGTIQSSCNNTFVKCTKNSDCGTDGFSGDLFCLSNNSYQNFVTYKCNNAGSGSSSCTSTSTSVLKQTCNSMCSNGNCVGCFSDSGCGTDGFIGSKYCKGKDVYQDFEDFSCSNPGQSNSQCLTNTVEKLITSCADSCYNGECKNVVCTNTNDCNDNNAYTLDECNNAGSTSSYCSHTPMNCLSNNDCGITGFSGNEFCIGGGVFKNYQESNCRNPGTRLSYCDVSISQQFIVDCGTGKTCSSGICMPVKCNSNAECGKTGYLNQLFCEDNNILDKYAVYTCNNPGSAISSCSSTTQDKSIKTCQYGCENGACLPQCTKNSDCSQGQVCLNNQCINVVCSTNADCNDNNDHTVDTCLNPGTTQSSCTHTPINCNTNLECGTNGFVGNTFCQNNNVFQNFLTYTCNNAGTSQSSCSSSPNALLKQTCQYGCTNGICNNNQCVDVDQDGYDTCSPGTPGDDGKPLDCNDNNANVHPNAVEICNGIDDNCNGLIDEGTNICGSNQLCVQGQCLPVACSSNSQCGTDHFLNQLFCKNNNAFDKFLTYTCNNPGTVLSSCSSSTSDVLKQTCSYGCTNGNCNQNSCVDVDQDGYDTCSPGTPGDDGKPLDCNDNNANVNPGKTEVCNGIDDNCNGQIDEGGVCVCSQNSDCGTNHNLNQLFCKNNNSYDKFITYTCNNVGTPANSCSSVTSDVLKQTCSFGCTSGNCNNNSCVDKDLDGYDTCSPGTPGDDGNPIDCNDNNANVHPNAIEICNGIDDNCNGLIDEGTNICGSNQLCVQGQCLPVACSNDEQCNDSNAHTFDKCNNPGTTSSFCSHTPIVCLNSNECGINGFANGLFCESNNIVQNFVSFTCNNPGTIQSSCASMIVPQLNKTCQYGCTNGICNNNPCIDVDQDGYDTCNPGTPGDDGKPLDCNDNNANVHPNAVEICNGIDDNCNGQIDEGGVCVCSQNSDCGTNHNLNQLFCKNNNSYDKFITYTCNNVGTPANSCSSVTSDVLKQTCSFGCTSGNCNNNSCVDKDLDGYDTCNPGTPGDDGKPLDCNDNNANVHPNAVEICNGIDDNCNGQIDEGGVCVCSQNSDCGTNHNLNQLFCKDGNSYDKFITYTCNNVGTPANSCSNVTSDVLKQTCSFGCTSGVCNNPVINCTNNGECGTDHFLNQLFCKDGNVFDKFLTYTCNNPGTTQSSCSSSTSDVLKQTCNAPDNGKQFTWEIKCGDASRDNYNIACDESCGPCYLTADGYHFWRKAELKEMGYYYYSNGVKVEVPYATGNNICRDGTSPVSGSGTIPAGITIAGQYTKWNWGGSYTLYSDASLDSGRSGVAPYSCSRGNGRTDYYWDDTGSGNAHDDGRVIFTLGGNVASNGQTCSNGQCQNIVCSTDAQCNDNNPGTIDKCINPGTTSSYCTNTPTGCQPGTFTFNNAWEIRSFINSYYGSTIVKDTEPDSAALKYDSATKQKICELKGYNKVVSATSDYYRSCYNNGIVYWDTANNKFVTTNSCNFNQYIDRLVCEKTCPVIICSTDAQCNDNNPGTIDKCINPGTTSSSCTHTPICTSTGSQNANNPKPYQCGGDDWNIGLPKGITCTGSVTTLGSLDDDPKTISITGDLNRLRPDLATLNKYCQQYTGEALSYATYGRMHNYCTACDQRLAWFENNQWSSQAVCAGTLNVQQVKCATGCTLQPGC